MSVAPLDKRGVASVIRTISFNIGFVLSLNITIISMVQFIPYDVALKLIMAAGLVSDIGTYTLTDLCNALTKSFLLQAIAMAAAIPFTLSGRLERKF